MTFEWKEEEIRSRLSSMLDHIISTAKEDDIVTEEESSLIDVMRNHILSFEDQFAQMSGKHTDIETVKSRTKDLFEKAIEATTRQARQDGTITSDELILIDRLAKSLRNEDLTKYLKS